MRMTEAQIRRIIKEELINVLEVQDPTVVKRFAPKPTKNMATNPEVRTKPQSGNVPSIAKREIEFNRNEPIKSLEELVRTNPQFRNILVASTPSKDYSYNPTISNFIKNYFVLDQKSLDDVMEKANSSGAINRLRRMALRIPAYRESKTK
jgi:hypothetical protein